MNTFVLKLIACLSMLIDHATALFVDEGSKLYFYGRGIGRLAFPIFCFLIVEGYFHTKDVKKYLLRLLAFAFISELPFDFAFWKEMNMSSILSNQNVFFTLFLGLLTITVYNILVKKFQTQTVLGMIFGVLTIVAGGAFSILIRSDYTFIGIAIIVGFYLFHGNKKKAILSFLVVGAFFFGGIQSYAFLAVIPIWMYNGEKGPNVRYVFYAFYPVHLLLLGAIVKMIG